MDKAPYRSREGPIEDGCDCYTCGAFSAAYLHHLFKARELLAYRLATIHNLRFVLRLMEEMRAAIAEGGSRSIEVGSTLRSRRRTKRPAASRGASG